MTQIIRRLSILPRWVIIVFDFIVLIFAGIVGFALRFNFEWADVAKHHPVHGILLLSVGGTIASLITKNYAGIVRFTGIDDALRILRTSILNLGIATFSNAIFYYNFNRNLIPYSVILIFLFISVFMLLFYRLMVKNIYSFYRSEVNKKINVVIFGAGQLGLSTLQALDADHKGKHKVVGFLEDDIRKAGKRVNGVQIYSTRLLPKLVKTLHLKEVIISVPDLSQQRRNSLVDVCLRYQLKVKVIPSVEKWVSGDVSQQIREIKIEDLLGRTSISLDDGQLLNSLRGKVICITGAAGSIGSEITHQVLKYHPKALILIDQGESPIYELQRSISTGQGSTSLFFYVADISDEKRIGRLLKDHKPDIIFHAAAYKHVPLMESNPSEAIKTNIHGTKILADLAVKNGVKKFVMISTDKAVNPTNIMGCSKRIAEIYVQSLNTHLELLGTNQTKFITTRFGNVLGSNGSVIPLFQKQIDLGGPITVTHPEVIRYFMTIPEACRLVLEAADIGDGGEIFIFDMGRPIRIYDLARKMVLLAGLEPGKDIEIVFTGLRDGEKLYEELLNNSENTIPTHHEKILIAKTPLYSYLEVLKNVEFLFDLMYDHNELKMVAMMKEIVPEYKSNFSRFGVLDTKSVSFLNETGD